MNATLLLMSSALASGGDVVPAGWGERPPAVVHAGGCTPVPTVPAPGPCCDTGRTKLLDKLKAKFGAKKGSDCCEPSAPRYYQPNLLDKVKERSGPKKSCGCTEACPAPACPAAVVAPAAVPVPPKDVTNPKVKPDPDAANKGGNVGSAPPGPNPVAPKLSGTTSPY